jgi:hypothetical protein
VITRFLFPAAGAVVGLLAVPVLASLPFPGSAYLAVALCTAAGVARGWALADRLEARRWTAQRCWEILRDDRNPMRRQERAAARLAQLGRGVVADPSGWWPWRTTYRITSETAGKLRDIASWAREGAYPFNGVEP